MARVCDICNKKILSGHNVSHSHRKTKRRWRPNLQKKKILIDGKLKEVKICTKCLRSMEKTK